MLAVRGIKLKSQTSSSRTKHDFSKILYLVTIDKAQKSSVDIKWNTTIKCVVWLDSPSCKDVKTY